MVHAQTFHHLQVAVECARITIEVLSVIELRRVHEDADDDNVILFAASLDKRFMPAVERSHGGHKTDTTPIERAPPFQPCGRGVPDFDQE
jgi:hypothetical protein